MLLASVNVALPPKGGTAIDKRSVTGPVAVAELGLDGDGQGDRRNHGGPDQAVYAYGVPDYEWWSAELGRTLLPATFGENLTITGLESAGLAIGDRLAIGSTLLEVTSPRIPCSTLATRMDDARFARRFQDARRPGVYLRVLETGTITVGDDVRLERAPAGALPVLALQDLYYAKSPSREEVERALGAPVAIRARRDLERRLSKLAAAG